MSARCRTNWIRPSRCPRRSRRAVYPGEGGQTNFLGSVLNLERVFRPEYLLADHERPVEYETTLPAPLCDQPAPARRAPSFSAEIITRGGERS